MSASNLNLLDCISLLIIMLSMPLGWSLDLWIHGLLHLLRWLATSTNMGWSLGSLRLFRVKDRLIAMPGCSSTGKINYKELCTYAQWIWERSFLDMRPRWSLSLRRFLFMFGFCCKALCLCSVLHWCIHLALDCTLDLGCILGTTYGVCYLRLYLLGGSCGLLWDDALCDTVHVVVNISCFSLELLMLHRFCSWLTITLLYVS